MDRRTFLKLAGIGSLSFAAGCSDPEKTIYSLVKAPDDMVTGQAKWYATTCRECPAGCGVLVKNREGRVIKIEGNPLHPINKGKVCIRGQAALQGVYNPGRLKSPILKTENGLQNISFSDAENLLSEKFSIAKISGSGRIKMMTEVVSRPLYQIFDHIMTTYGADAPTVFEPFAYESLKTANEMVFGIDGLFSYKMEQSDFLISFGADFLDTWLSPVEYTIKFKEMHGVRNGKKGRFVHISPSQTLTAANADTWIPCNIDDETIVALGLIREMIVWGKGETLDKSLLGNLQSIADPYTIQKVSEQTGISERLISGISESLVKSRHPLVLGSGNSFNGERSLETCIASNLLNLLLNPDLSQLDFNERYRVETAARRSEIYNFFNEVSEDKTNLLLLNNVNPVFTLPKQSGVQKALKNKSVFVVCFSNFMDETSAKADMVIPVAMPLESWDVYESTSKVITTLQPAMKPLYGDPQIGDLLIRSSFKDVTETEFYKTEVIRSLVKKGSISTELQWLNMVRNGGLYNVPENKASFSKKLSKKIFDVLLLDRKETTIPLSLAIMPSVRFFDGRGANRPWLSEIPDPLTKVVWQAPVLMHPETVKRNNLKHGDMTAIETDNGLVEAIVYETAGIKENVLGISMRRDHTIDGQFIEDKEDSIFSLLSANIENLSGGPISHARVISIKKAKSSEPLAHTDGSRLQHDRKIAMAMPFSQYSNSQDHKKTHGGSGLSMHEFPLTLPIPEGYDAHRDIYPSHEHENYRWAMVVDLDRCVGCAACMGACYAENNIGIAGKRQIINGREMSWVRVERYLDPEDNKKVIFLPMMCQHCDAAPCESVCPVYAPHHSKEGLNNQIYNRCIGTRFCSQNCPYKVRRFNWFGWKWPYPLNLQLNPDVTARSKGVMEKCSFCIQRIKEAHTTAKREKRKIKDGEVIPACAQTCPSDVFTFGNLMDPESRVSKLVSDKRAYQVMGYLNTKPAVIYLKKILNEI
ncbi:MAG: 4Fe-4S dicluster domain-containing protein [Desulfobacterales bacterium]|nr:4Fe-4S dicluster domain-containing protein [Desulfobacterales bacterium]